MRYNVPYPALQQLRYERMSHRQDDFPSLFDIPDGVTYLNTAGAAPRLRAANAAAQQALQLSARPWEITTEEWLQAGEDLRGLAASVMDTSPDALAMVPAVSYGMAVAAHNLDIRRGDRIVLLSGEYPSNRAIWMRRAEQVGARVVNASPAPGESWTAAVTRCLQQPTRVLCIPHCYWRDGAQLDLLTLSAQARAVGAAVVIDASQSLGALPLDFDAIAPDFVVSAGFKWLLGANGLAWLWGAPRWRNHGEPIEQSWLQRRSRSDVGAIGNGLPPYRDGAGRFDGGGSLHPLNVPMARVGLEQLQRWGVSETGIRIGMLTGRLRRQLAARGLGNWIADDHAPHICALRPPLPLLPRIADAMAAQRIIVAQRGDCLRISPHLHITENTVDAVIDVIAGAA